MCMSIAAKKKISMLDGKLSKYTSNHPFIFLISPLLVVSCCPGVFLAVTRAVKMPDEQTTAATATVTSTTSIQATITFQSTDTVSELRPTDNRAAPFEKDFNPTTTNTVGPEQIATSQFATASPTVTAAIASSTKPLMVHFINVGQGDSILIVSPDGQTTLIDGGSANTGVLAYLKEQGVKQIDLMVATHPHEDHIGGLVQVLEALPVARVITNGIPATTSVYEHFLDAILSSKAKYSEVKRGDTITLGELNFSVLNPGENLGDDLNESSILLRLVYDRTTILFMGDAGEVA